MAAIEVFWAFLKLGCTAFGGPVAHLGYFQGEFVVRRRWLSEEEFADLIALCQFLPGPASSQVGLALGYRQAGAIGAAAAWLGFTLPSAAFMVAFAFGMGKVGNLGHAGWVHGLKVAAVAVVAQAVALMAKRLCPDVPRAAIAIAAALAVSLFTTPLGQLLVLASGALLGAAICPPGRALDSTVPVHRRVPFSAAAGCLAAFVGLLVFLPIGTEVWPGPRLAMVSALYRSGALVFGGGHVVLPLLAKATVDRGWLPQDVFLAGYGAAQALPGPLFAFAAYLGVEIAPGGISGAVAALASLYLPGVLILFAALPHWERLRTSGPVRRLLSGANAAVVGILAAALVSPIGTSTIVSWRSSVLALAALAALQFPRFPSWAVVIGCAALGAAFL